MSKQVGELVDDKTIGVQGRNLDTEQVTSEKTGAPAGKDSRQCQTSAIRPGGRSDALAARGVVCALLAALALLFSSRRFMLGAADAEDDAGAQVDPCELGACRWSLLGAVWRGAGGRGSECALALALVETELADRYGDQIGDSLPPLVWWNVGWRSSWNTAACHHMRERVRLAAWSQACAVLRGAIERAATDADVFLSECPECTFPVLGEFSHCASCGACVHAWQPAYDDDVVCARCGCVSWRMGVARVDDLDERRRRFALMRIAGCLEHFEPDELQRFAGDLEALLRRAEDRDREVQS